MGTVTQPVEVRNASGVMGGFVTVPKAKIVKQFLERHCQEHDVPIFFHFMGMTYDKIIVIDRFRPVNAEPSLHRALMLDFIKEIEGVPADMVMALVIEQDNQAAAEQFHAVLSAQGFSRWWNTRNGYLMKLDVRGAGD